MRKFYAALMMCIGMMCFTGFGQTTSDLGENSTAVVIQVDEPVNVVAHMPMLLDSSIVQSANDVLLVHRYSYESCEYLVVEPFKGTELKPPDILGGNQYTYTTINTRLLKIEAQPTYRKARDGLNSSHRA